MQCNSAFRTYVPGVATNLPGGGIVLYNHPQTLCPNCDPGMFGLFMNEDLFPNLCGGQVVEEIKTDDTVDID